MDAIPQAATEFTNKTFDEESGKLLKYQKLITHTKYWEVWMHSSKFGELAQGVGGQIGGQTQYFCPQAPTSPGRLMEGCCLWQVCLWFKAKQSWSASNQAPGSLLVGTKPIPRRCGYSNCKFDILVSQNAHQQHNFHMWRLIHDNGCAEFLTKYANGEVQIYPN